MTCLTTLSYDDDVFSFPLLDILNDTGFLLSVLVTWPDRLSFATEYSQKK